MRDTIWASSETVVGGCRRGATPMIRRSPTHAAYDDVGGRVGQALLVVSMGDAGAVAVERPEGESGLGPLGQVRGHASGAAGSASSSRHQRSHWRQAPAYMARVEGASSASMAVAIRPASASVSRARGGASRTVGMRSGFVMANCRRRARSARMAAAAGGRALRKGGFPEGGSSLNCFLARDSH